ncbi:MAG: lambda exonuclease family protein [Candidatus Omnitrophota bacterium]
MIVAEVLQGTPEWLAARLGIPTASGFDRIITTKGEPSKQAQKYMYQLAAERITGAKEEGYQNGVMQRGMEMEAEARAMYEFITGNEVKTVGVCYPDEKKAYGCSPDGLVNSDGLVEIKCPTSPVHVAYLLSGELPAEYFQQVQGQLLVTGRKYVDFFSFYPGLKPLPVRVERDEKFIKALMVELEIFVKELDEITERIRKI